MTHGERFWKLEHLSNAQLLESLGGVMRTQRRSLAELVAHLGEVEDRRLHLEAAHSSMFAYCVSRLGMSEDEACRRIELARLARRFPALFAELGSGQITLSVALVLKPVLSASNLVELLAAARGKSVRQARELVAERFPKADAPSSIRKLPERAPVGPVEPSKALTLAPLSLPAPQPLLAPQTLLAPPQPSSPPPSPAPAILALGAPSPASVLSSPQSSSLAPRAAATSASRSCIEPLSAQRYRIQFTADAGLKQKLELARDLLRHAQPSGDFGPIVSRALDLLIEDLLRRRFGVGARRRARRAGAANAAQASSSAGSAEPGGSTSESVDQAPPSAAGAHPTEASPTVSSTARPALAPLVSRAARRSVLERDGLGCSWLDAHGVRCGSHAWLEIDHRQPSGKGGSSEPDNLRLLCRAHNQLAAEHEYGREHIERRSRRRREMDHPLPT